MKCDLQEVNGANSLQIAKKFCTCSVLAHIIFDQIEGCIILYGKVRELLTSGKFGHSFANSGYPDKTAPHQDFHCFLSYLFFIPIIKI